MCFRTKFCVPQNRHSKFLPIPFQFADAYASINARTGFSFVPSPAFKNDTLYSRLFVAALVEAAKQNDIDIRCLDLSGEDIVIISAPASRKVDSD